MTMAETVVQCYHSSDGNLLAELADHMGKTWKDVKLSDANILELEKYLAIMMPMKQYGMRITQKSWLKRLRSGLPWQTRPLCGNRMRTVLNRTWKSAELAKRT